MNEAKEIRNELKKQGWNVRQVSVRRSKCSIDVTIKDAKVPLSVVESIAKKHEVINRCEYSGDILSGANTFVRVDYADEVIKPLVKQLLELMPKEHGQSLNVGKYEIVYLEGNYRYHKPDKELGNFFETKYFYDDYSCARSLVIDWLS